MTRIRLTENQCRLRKKKVVSAEKSFSFGSMFADIPFSATWKTVKHAWLTVWRCRQLVNGSLRNTNLRTTPKQNILANWVITEII